VIRPRSGARVNDNALGSPRTELVDASHCRAPTHWHGPVSMTFRSIVPTGRLSANIVDLRAQLLAFIDRYNPTAKPFASTYEGKPSKHEPNDRTLNYGPISSCFRRGPTLPRPAPPRPTKTSQSPRGQDRWSRPPCPCRSAPARRGVTRGTPSRLVEGRPSFPNTTWPLRRCCSHADLLGVS